MMNKPLFLLLLLPILMSSQTSNKNYITSSVYSEETTTSNLSNASTVIMYYDGLARPSQEIYGEMSATGKDIIKHVDYDSWGREARKYLSYPSVYSNLTFDTNAENNTVIHYNTIANDYTTNPYYENYIEPAPNGKILKNAFPGTPWQSSSDNSDHTVKFVHTSNKASEVKIFRATSTWNSAYNTFTTSITSNGSSYYPINDLFKTIKQSENKLGNIYLGSTSSLKLNTVEEFKNKEGQIILKRTYNKNLGINQTTYEILDTYYIYDQFGNLSFILPPIAGGNTSELDALCYQYKYDEKNRVVERKSPGKEWEFFVYDSNNNQVASGPVLSPFGGADTGWMVYAYDKFGRITYTGWRLGSSINSAARKVMQLSSYPLSSPSAGSATIDGLPVYYNNVFPSGTKLLTVNYYDGYSFLSSPPSTSTVIENVPVLLTPRGLITGSWQRVITTSSEMLGESSYVYYNKEGRKIRSYSANYLGGYNQVDSKIRFDGALLYTISKQKRLTGDNELVIREDFTYSSQNRLINRTHKIGNLPTENLCAYTYEELGRLASKRWGSGGTSITGELQTVNYKYNIRGWLTEINNFNGFGTSWSPSDKFALKINYNTIDASLTNEIVPLYNGSISEIYWRSASDNVLRKYSYKYDNLDRVIKSFYQKPLESIQLTNSYNEAATYDKNGNIKTLSRNGGFDDPTTTYVIDDLSYVYDGTCKNQLIQVTDSSNSPQGFKDGINLDNDYSYDIFGNMTIDKNKGITSISYNHLNLPIEIIFSNGNKIKYIYRADGSKQTKKLKEGNTEIEIDYLNGFIYKNGLLQFFNTEEGYVDYTVVLGVGRYSYVYQYKDHLGSVRMDCTLNKVGETVIKEENHYYPFGSKHINYNMDELEFQEIQGQLELYPPITATGKLPNNFMYNGKEMQDELGLMVYDYGARNYDAALGRWSSIDPLTDKFPESSPYAYVKNNPLAFIDPDGKDIYRYDHKTGDLVLFETNDDETDMIGKFDYDKKTKTYTLRTDNKGKPKSYVDKIAKGILKDGINFEHNHNVIAVNGEGKPTEQQVIDFLVSFSDNLNGIGEISGFGLGDSGLNDNITAMWVEPYEGNTTFSNKSLRLNKNYVVSNLLKNLVKTELPSIRLFTKYHYHTHPKYGGNAEEPDINVPSLDDLKNKAQSDIDQYIFNSNGRFKY